MQLRLAKDAFDQLSHKVENKIRPEKKKLPQQPLVTSSYGLKAAECRQILDRIVSIVYAGSLKAPDLWNLPIII